MDSIPLWLPHESCKGRFLSSGRVQAMSPQCRWMACQVVSEQTACRFARGITYKHGNCQPKIPVATLSARCIYSWTSIIAALFHSFGMAEMLCLHTDTKRSPPPPPWYCACRVTNVERAPSIHHYTMLGYYLKPSKQASKQASKPANKQAGRQASKQASKQASSQQAYL